MSGQSEPSYRISELAKSLGTTARTIRHYEAEGLLSPARETAGRIYSERDRRRLLLILKGVRVGFSLGDLRELLSIKDLKDGAGTQQLTRAVEHFSARMAELERKRTDIDSMLDDLRDGRAQIELALARRGHRMTSSNKRPKLIGFGLQPADD